MNKQLKSSQRKEKKKKKELSKPSSWRHIKDSNQRNSGSIDNIKLAKMRKLDNAECCQGSSLAKSFMGSRLVQPFWIIWHDIDKYTCIPWCSNFATDNLSQRKFLAFVYCKIYKDTYYSDVYSGGSWWQFG